MRDARDVTLELAAAIREARDNAAALAGDFAGLAGLGTAVAGAARDMASNMHDAATSAADLTAALLAARAAAGTFRVDVTGASSAAAAASTVLIGRGMLGWLTFGNFLTVAHVLLVAFASQVAADAIGIAAFGIAVANNIGPAIGAVGKLTTAYSDLSVQQKNAALVLQQFVDALRGGANTAVFGVFYQGLSLVKQAMNSGTNVTEQATQAFGDFAAMLKGDFASPAWAQAFGSNSHIVRADLDALFRTINNGIMLIPAFFHNFNDIGLAVMGVVSGFLHGVRAVMEWNSVLTKSVALATFAYGVYKIFWAGLGAGPGILARASTALVGFGTRVAVASTYLRNGGLAAASYALGINGTVLAAGLAVGAIVAFAAAGGIAIAVLSNLGHSAEDSAAAMVTMFQAVGNNVTGYRQLIAAAEQQIQTALHSANANAQNGRAIEDVARAFGAVRDAAQASLTAVMTNARNLGQVLGVTTHQAIAFATAVGVDLSKPMSTTSQQFADAAAKMRGYAQAVRLSHSALSQFKVDVLQSKDAANTLTDQVNALGAAFSAFVTPTLNAAAGAITLKNDMVQATTAIDKANHTVGLHTQAQRDAGAAIVQAARDALTQSSNIKTLTGSTSAAAGPLKTFVAWMDSMHVHGQLAAAILAKIKAAEDALYNKTVTVQINTVQTGGGITHIIPPGMPGSGGAGTFGGHAIIGGGAVVVVHNHVSGVINDHTLLELGRATTRAVAQHTTRNGSNQLFLPTRGH
jgi:hypothetical protein